MIGVVSFDFFQPSAYIDFNFTEMPSWSTNFEWLGFDSINFIDCLGSIIIFAIFFILWFMIGLILLPMRFCCNCCKRYFKMDKIARNFMAFIDGTFYQILICVSISMAMIRYSSFYNDADTVSVVL